MNECKHENAALRVEELDEIEVCADCGVELGDLADDDTKEED